MIIIWTSQALFNYENSINYLLEKWSFKEAQDFIDSVSELEEQLKKFPLSFPQSENKKYLRKAVLGKHHSVIYQVDGKELVFINFLFNKQLNKD